MDRFASLDFQLDDILMSLKMLLVDVKKANDELERDQVPFDLDLECDDLYEAIANLEHFEMKMSQVLPSRVLKMTFAPAYSEAMVKVRLNFLLFPSC